MEIEASADEGCMLYNLVFYYGFNLLLNINHEILLKHNVEKCQRIFPP